MEEGFGAQHHAPAERRVIDLPVRGIGKLAQVANGEAGQPRSNPRPTTPKAKGPGNMAGKMVTATNSGTPGTVRFTCTSLLIRLCRRPLIRRPAEIDHQSPLEPVQFPAKRQGNQGVRGSFLAT